ncbi:hypothetical protein CEXT_458111 [Caerostris extrusa]|uniref:Uncharacterized protein n=1 Tax=Caerostris extrusa TaxID=172846 RepID=A0AAV4WTS3_CAEEX|nr:hypothetical protein CEXT_458111 [Caerostris extrusa]
MATSNIPPFGGDEYSLLLRGSVSEVSTFVTSRLSPNGQSVFLLRILSSRIQTVESIPGGHSVRFGETLFTGPHHRTNFSVSPKPPTPLIFVVPYAHGQLFPHEDVRVVGLGEAPLQLLQLRWREPGPVPLLLDGLVAAAAAPRLAGRRAPGVRGAVQPVQDLQRAPASPPPPLLFSSPDSSLEPTKEKAANGYRRLSRHK